MSTPEPGVYKDVPFEEYQQWDAVNPSSAKHALSTMSKYKYYRDNPNNIENSGIRFGSLYHLIVLEPQKASEMLVIPPESYENSAGEVKPWHNGAAACKAWREEQEEAGNIIVKEEDLEQVKAMSSRLRENKLFLPYFTNGERELSLVWDCVLMDGRSIRCKGRLDLFANGEILDLKTTGGRASTDPFRNEIERRRYWLQAVMYCDGVRTLMPEYPEPDFSWLVQETYPPYDHMLYQASELILWRDFRGILQQIADCQERGVWPGYIDPEASAIDHFAVIDPPAWAGTSTDGRD